MIIREPPFRIGLDFNEYIGKFRAKDQDPAKKIL